jgi:hypothetical protein
VPVKVKNVLVMDDIATTPLDASSDVVGLDVDSLEVRVEIDPNGVADADLPTEIQIEVMSHQPPARGDAPKVRKPGGPADQSSMSRPLRASALRFQGSYNYIASVGLSELAPFMKSEDEVLEVATVVRAGGTSDKEFLGPLVKAGWARRGSAVQPDAGKPDATGDIAKELPDARQLFRAGGVEVLDINVVPDPALILGARSKAKAFIRSPADVFFYSGHGAWWNCSLLRKQAGDDNYDTWMKSKDLVPQWRRQPSMHRSPLDLDVLIINGCSVLLWDKEGFYNPTEVPSCGLRWRKLLWDREGPLQAILGYRDTAPLDASANGGNDVARAMAVAIANGLGDRWDQYARKWLEINARHPITYTAAAIDLQGYWYINMKEIRDSHTGKMRDMDNYDSSKTVGNIIGPLPLP